MTEAEAEAGAEFVTPEPVTNSHPTTLENLAAEFTAELSRYAAAVNAIEDDAAAASSAVRAARDPELDPIRLSLGKLLIRIRPTIGDGSRVDFAQWCHRRSTGRLNVRVGRHR